MAIHHIPREKHDDAGSDGSTLSELATVERDRAPRYQAEPAPLRWRGVRFRLSWSFGFHFTRPKREVSPCPEPAAKAERQSVPSTT